MSKCKIAVVRELGGLFNIGDTVDAFPFDMFLGKEVEPQGGRFVVVEVTNADETHDHIQKLITTWEVDNPAYIMGDLDAMPKIPHPQYKRKFYLQPQNPGDPFFLELFNTGRVSGTIETVMQYTLERTDGD